MNNEVIVRDQTSPLDLMRMAVEKGMSTEQLKILFDLNNENNALIARQAFTQAKCNVQARAEAVVKSSDNPATRSKYAKLEEIDKMIKPIITDEGLAVDFAETDCPKEDHMRVTMTVTHKLGHSEERHLDFPLDGAGIKGQSNKTALHAKASTFSYGKRYLKVSYFDIPIVGEDDDGNQGKQPEKAKSPEEVKAALRASVLPRLQKAAEQGYRELEAMWKRGISEPARQACLNDWGDLKGTAMAVEATRENTDG